MQQEVAKQKPQSACVTSLMQRTFTKRRQWILDEMRSVKEICEEYPCLSKPAFVSKHGNMFVCHNIDRYDSYWSTFTRYMSFH